MKVKEIIKVLQDNYDLEEEIWYDIYSEDDLDLIDVQATPKEWLEIIARCTNIRTMMRSLRLLTMC